MAETNTERLEKVKVTFGDKFIHTDIAWLLKQAEMNIKCEGGFYGKLAAKKCIENKRLREALEQVYELSKHDNQSHYLDRCYVVVRQALEGDAK